MTVLDPQMIRFLSAANRRLWDALADLHHSEESYGANAVVNGGISLHKLELDRIGNVKGKKILHLQCHFGIDSLSLARLGATVTAVDFSERAILIARELGVKSNLTVEFICADIYQLQSRLQQRFDLVYCSFGVVEWLHDIPAWASIVRSYLAEHGSLHLFDIHPLVHCLHHMKVLDVDALSIQGDYFRRWAQLHAMSACYGSPQLSTTSALTGFKWQHSISEIVTAMINSKLLITRFEEFPFLCYRKFDFMISGDDGFWHLPQNMNCPMSFYIEAKPQ